MLPRLAGFPGVCGEFLRAAQALYALVPMGVQFADGLSSTFESLLGVKQGCPLSPTLFGIFMAGFCGHIAVLHVDISFGLLFVVCFVWFLFACLIACLLASLWVRS